MRVGLKLVESGIITAEQLVRALQRHVESRPQLGALAVDAGKLTMKQVFAILRTQADRPERKFGELAVEAGLMSEDEIAALMFRQMTSGDSLAELIVEMGFAEREDVETSLAEFRRSIRSKSAGEFSVAG